MIMMIFILFCCKLYNLNRILLHLSMLRSPLLIFIKKKKKKGFLLANWFSYSSRSIFILFCLNFKVLTVEGVASLDIYNFTSQN